MKIYCISDSHSERVDGRFPQVEKHDPSQNWVGLENLQQGNFKEVPRVILHSEAKLTDFLVVVMISGQGMVVSKKAKEIISSQVPEIKVQPINVLDKQKQIHNYYYIFSERTDNNFDLDDCSIVEITSRKFIRKVEGIHSLNDLFKDKHVVDNKIRINYLALNESIPNMFFSETYVLVGRRKEMFRSCNVFVTEKLKRSLEKAGCIGMSFSKIPDEPVIPI